MKWVYLIVAAAIGGYIFSLHTQNGRLEQRIIGCSAGLKSERDRADKYQRDADEAAKFAIEATKINAEKAKQIKGKRNETDGPVAPVLTDTLRMLNDLQHNAE
jgi:hypothetical protein